MEVDDELGEVKNKPGRPKRQKTREEYAQEMLKHAAKFPGSYRPEEHFNSDHNENFRAWTREKIRLQECFDVVSTVGINGVKAASATIRVPVVIPKRSDRIDAESYYEKYIEKVEHMGTLAPGSEAWKLTRTEAYNLKNRYLNRCEIDHINPHDNIPEIPKYIVTKDKK